MSRRPSKFKRTKLTLTPPEIVVKAASESIDNFSAYLTSCLLKHLVSEMKDPEKKKCLIDKYGVDLIFFMRSYKFVKDLGIPHPIEHDPTLEETLALVKELGI